MSGDEASAMKKAAKLECRYFTLKLRDSASKWELNVHEAIPQKGIAGRIDLVSAGTSNEYDRVVLAAAEGGALQAKTMKQQQRHYYRSTRLCVERIRMENRDGFINPSANSNSSVFFSWNRFAPNLKYEEDAMKQVKGGATVRSIDQAQLLSPFFFEILFPKTFSDCVERWEEWKQATNGACDDKPQLTLTPAEAHSAQPCKMESFSYPMVFHSAWNSVKNQLQLQIVVVEHRLETGYCFSRNLFDDYDARNAAASLKRDDDENASDSDEEEERGTAESKSKTEALYEEGKSDEEDGNGKAAKAARPQNGRMRVLLRRTDYYFDYTLDFVPVPASFLCGE